MNERVKTAIFQTKFTDLKDEAGNVYKASTFKIVLLALAFRDLNQGGGAFPGLKRLEVDTALSRPTIVNACKVLKQKGILVLTGKSKYGTNIYTINIQAIGTTFKDGQAASPVKPPDQSSQLTNSGQATLPVKPLDLNHSLNIIKSFNDNDNDFNDDDDDDKSTFLGSSLSSSFNDSVNCAISTKRILNETHLLFGTNVMTNETILSRPPEWALAWVNKAYYDSCMPQNPKGLTNPQGLVYSRLMDGISPPAFLLVDPSRGLPDEYLVAIGMLRAGKDLPEVDDDSPQVRAGGRRDIRSPMDDLFDDWNRLYDRRT